jgi:hypothetical protein
MPKAMQLRKGQFGMAGRTKWTHLTNEDTTDFLNPWAQADDIRRKFVEKWGGGGEGLMRGRGGGMKVKSTSLDTVKRRKV